MPAFRATIARRTPKSGSRLAFGDFSGLVRTLTSSAEPELPTTDIPLLSRFGVAL